MFKIKHNDLDVPQEYWLATKLRNFQFYKLCLILIEESETTETNSVRVEDLMSMMDITKSTILGMLKSLAYKGFLTMVGEKPIHFFFVRDENKKFILKKYEKLMEKFFPHHKERLENKVEQFKDWKE